ncbi:MAG: acyl-protein synthetase [Polyangiaceae bacterium]|nr:acyl-protein synthetase [Polyangiaceae bacterium]
MSDDALSESDALHRRVQELVRAPDDGFDALALDIARHQARHCPGFRRLVESKSSALDTVDSIPAVPADAFRFSRVACHPPELDAVRFHTSGTTDAARGVHPMRRTDTYRQIAVRGGRQALVTAWPQRRVVVALAPNPGAVPTSSLGFMMRAFMEELDGRALVTDPTGAAFDPDSPARWLATPHGIDITGLSRAALVALERQEPLLVLSTAFALVALLDELGGKKLRTPKHTVIMQTGGFKGRTRSVAPEKLRARVARVFGIAKERVVGEYGMTELSSQLYEGTLPGAELEGEAGLYLPPPWLRVTAVDPITLRPVPEGEVGIARFVDLGNVDSAVAIVTQDRIVQRAGGIELLGRRPGAPLRGCSLAAEELIVTSTRA